MVGFRRRAVIIRFNGKNYVCVFTHNSLSIKHWELRERSFPTTGHKPTGVVESQHCPISPAVNVGEALPVYSGDVCALSRRPHSEQAVYLSHARTR